MCGYAAQMTGSALRRLQLQQQVQAREGDGVMFQQPRYMMMRQIKLQSSHDVGKTACMGQHDRMFTAQSPSCTMTCDRAQIGDRKGQKEVVIATAHYGYFQSGPSHVLNSQSKNQVVQLSSLPAQTLSAFS